ncbi:MAG: hypothetical protein V3T77_05145, partial [Planctomycetota bacterium]
MSLLSAVLMTLFWTPLPAQDLSLLIKPLVYRSRSRAPLLVEVRLDWLGGEGLPGHLEMVLFDGQVNLGRYHSPRWTLSQGEQAYRLLLPSFPPSPLTDAQQLLAEVAFVSGGRVIPLGEHLLAERGEEERTLVLGISVPEGQGNRYARVAGDLRLERFAYQIDGEAPSIRTVPVIQKPEKLPREAFGYFVYDLLLLAGDGFAELDPTQVAALEIWVRAGGSVCLIPGQGLQDHHLKVIQNL